MPGVLIVEAMAQACAILSFKALDTLPSPNTVYYFVGIDNARFKRPVEPGDQLILKASIKRRVKGIWMFEASAHVGDELAASAGIMCTYKEIA
jgi:3-hydroxyacyl-[acyl-carrier-protein] dehydratase